METLNNIVLTIQDYMSNIVLIIALLGAGIWFSFRLKLFRSAVSRGESSRFSEASLAKRERRETTV